MNDSEKRRLEKAACEHFLASYNKAHGTEYHIKTHCDKPNFVIEEARTGEIIGIEIMHSFYDMRKRKCCLADLKKEPRDYGFGSKVSRASQVLARNLYKAISVKILSCGGRRIK